MSVVTIRLARPDDLTHIPEISASGEETFARYGQPLGEGSAPMRPEQCEAPLAAGLLWIAEDEGGPIGFLAAEITGDALYVAEVDVLMGRQRQGHGRRLMQAAIDAARARGLAAVTLETFRNIPWNGPFYATLGFVEVPEEELTPHLAAAIAMQVAHGFTDRCAMRLAL
jgi:GNAT superfamily N-acetyltransferase